MSRRLRLTIDLPGFYVDDELDDAESIEEAMDLDSEQVVVVFAGWEGDTAMLRSLEGRIVRYEIAKGSA